MKGISNMKVNIQLLKMTEKYGYIAEYINIKSSKRHIWKIGSPDL